MAGWNGLAPISAAILTTADQFTDQSGGKQTPLESGGRFSGVAAAREARPLRHGRQGHRPHPLPPRA
jgi:hypothetical protein